MASALLQLRGRLAAAAACAPSALPLLRLRHAATARHASQRSGRATPAAQQAALERLAAMPSSVAAATTGGTSTLMAARSPAVREVLGDVSITSLAAAAARHTVLVPGSAAAATAAPTHAAAPVPAAVPAQPDSRTTVLLIGWLGSKKKHLVKYQQLHEAAGRRVIVYRPWSFGWLAHETLEQPRVLDCLRKLGKEAAQGRSIVIHALSNLGAFQVASVLHELQRQADPGTESPFSNAQRESMRVLVRQAIRGVVFDSAPAPLSPPLIARGYCGFVLSWLPFLRSGRQKGSHGVVRYDVHWLTAVVETSVKVLLRIIPSYRMHALTLHRSLLRLLPLSTNLLYVYSHADNLIPHEDVLSHAARQASLADPLLAPSSAASDAHDLPDRGRALVNVRSDRAASLAAELERDEQVFLSSFQELKKTNVSNRAIEDAVTIRNNKIHDQAPALTRPLRVASVRVHMEQLPEPNDASNDAAAHAPEAPGVDDPASLLAPLRAHLVRCQSVSAPSAPSSPSSKPPSSSSSDRLRWSSVDVLHGTETASRLDALDQLDGMLVRSVITARFHGSAHVAHLRSSPRSYAALIDAFVAQHASTHLPVASAAEVRRLRNEATQGALLPEQVDEAARAQDATPVVAAATLERA
jgi:hypothetical protein